MSEKTPQILVTAGPLKDSRFDVPQSGLRLGRSSSCEVSIKDPALSRNHCLFELRDGSLWITDLASANGTMVNGELLGPDSRELKPGDVIVAGDSSLEVVKNSPIQTVVPSAASGAEPPKGPKVDLGLGKEPEAAAANAPRFPMRIVVWAVALVVVVGSAMVILSGQGQKKETVAVKPIPQARPVLSMLSFEKIEANKEGVYRYALEMDKSGKMTVVIDDVPKENRQFVKSVQLSSNAVEQLTTVLSAPELLRLEPEHTGTPLVAGTLKSFALRLILDDKVFVVSIENTPEPNAFRKVREQLETFSKNELGIWGIQYSAEKLVEMSAEMRHVGDVKWEDRNGDYGNVAAALKAYKEAIVYLETVNPKPEFYGELVNRCDEVNKELDARYRDQRFLADRAINLADWPAAMRELDVLRQIVPDKLDPRHEEAANKLLDVQNRMKKGLK